MASNEMPLAIIGTGTVGSILAAYLIDGGHENVALIDVPERIEQIRERGIRITGKADKFVQPKHLYTDIEQLNGGSVVHTAIIAAKVTHLPKICKGLAKVHHPDMIVVSFQNGIGTENYIGKHIDQMKVARAIVNYAGVRDEETGDISMSWFIPPNFLGPFQEQDIGPYEEIAGLFTEVGLTTRAVPRSEIKRQAFFKTILNSALNALCATTGLTMSRAMGMSHTRFLARQLLREGLSVATQLGYHYGEDALETCMGYLDQGGDHYPSMWSDLQSKRRTEIDFINGKMVKIGMMYGHLTVPMNMFFTNMVMTQEIRAGARDENEIPPYLGCNVRLCY
jgi:2-dehydropantoate 2-reductase